MCNIYVSTGGWVHSVSFSPSGNKLAWIGHDSSVSVADAANGNR
jgi:actin related protein 2/3 complex subunit 1A/1B